VVGLARSAALAYIRDGLRINCICPGAVDTPMVAALPPERRASLLAAQPGGRLADAAELAAAVVWLCSDRASFVSGVALPIDNTWTAG
jgi:NAD(P)-dependent dehydrogenase (short-subunit alcohol dehydrogenase family)